MGELDFPINSTRPQQSGIKNINSIGTHDNFNIFTTFKAIQLIKQFQHSPLDFTVTPSIAFQPTASYAINFVHENYTRGMLFGHQE